MPTLSAAWTALTNAAQADQQTSILSKFDEPARLKRLCLSGGGLFLDLSKQPWSLAGLEAGLELVRVAGVEARRAKLFEGEVVNISEDRPVLHPALRAPDGAKFKARGEPVSGEVETGREKMARFSAEVRSGAIRGARGDRIKTVLHIGIGGSDLGPRLVWEALKPLTPQIELRFIANIDGADFAQAVAGLDPASTLVVAVSKTFTTLETLTNATAARDWLRANLGPAGDAQLVAVSANVAEASKFGVPEDRVFAFWDWVGGRYSVWSAVGLSCAVALGWEAFEGFLAGAHDMDEHFLHAPLEANLPVLLALAHVFNRNGLGRGSRAVVPYAQRLRLLPSYLQQLEMESNGKSATETGGKTLHATASAVFGDAGTNGQHAFFQLLHQGTDIIPLDIIAIAQSAEGPAGFHAKLLSNAIAQAEALLVGKSVEQVKQEMAAKGGVNPDEIAPQRAFSGNRPTSFILLDDLSPQAFGALIALYEHKTFVEGVLWGIDSFDQWGVELGKSLASRILPELEGEASNPHDPSTAALIMRLKR